MMWRFSEEFTSDTACLARSRSSGAGRGVMAGYRCFDGMSPVCPVASHPHKRSAVVAASHCRVSR